MRILVGEGSCGIAAGAGKVYDALHGLCSPEDSFSLEITAIMELLENDNRNTRLLAPPDIDGAIQKILQEQP